MNVYTNAQEVSDEVAARLAQITIANGYETNIGATIFEGRLDVNDADVPCASMIEGNDTVHTAPGRSALWKVEQRYGLVGYATCDPSRPNAAAHAMLRDLKRAMFKTNGKADATFGGKALHVEYKGRNIAPRADGAPIVMAILEIAVVFAESLP